MPPKKKVGKKKKGPTYYTSEEDTAPFGLKVNDILRTPLGLAGIVIGVKYENIEDKASGRLWVRYENGHEAPLEPRVSSGYIAALGYRRCSDADHIRRTVLQQEEEAKQQEQQRRVVQEIIRLKSLGLPIPDSLLPPKKAAKKGKGGKGKKKKPGSASRLDSVHRAERKTQLVLEARTAHRPYSAQALRTGPDLQSKP